MPGLGKPENWFDRRRNPLLELEGVLRIHCGVFPSLQNQRRLLNPGQLRPDLALQPDQFASGLERVDRVPLPPVLGFSGRALGH